MNSRESAFEKVFIPRKVQPRWSSCRRRERQYWTDPENKQIHASGEKAAYEIQFFKDFIVRARNILIPLTREANPIPPFHLSNDELSVVCDNDKMFTILASHMRRFFGEETPRGR